MGQLKDRLRSQEETDSFPLIIKESRTCDLSDTGLEGHGRWAWSGQLRASRSIKLVSNKTRKTLQWQLQQVKIDALKLCQAFDSTAMLNNKKVTNNLQCSSWL